MMTSLGSPCAGERSRYDVAIAGAGPAGAVTARLLAKAGCRVVVLERSRFEHARVGESLSPTIQPLLTTLGLWPQFRALRPLPSYGTRSVWGSAKMESQSHVISPWGCGWHVDRLAFDRMLAADAQAVGATVLCGTRLRHCERSGEEWRLTIDHDGSRDVRARLLIDATGRTAQLATMIGAQRAMLDRLVGVAITFGGIDIAREGYVQVEATAGGWWYSAPLPDDRMIVMFLTDGDLSGGENLASHAVWHRRFQETEVTRARVANGTPVLGPQAFSAISQRLRRRDTSRTPWIAVGDAALAVDPISGSGVIRALRAARAGANAALAMFDGHAPDIIDAYEADRDRECATYLEERAQYYGIEQRWPTSPFWQRRSAQC